MITYLDGKIDALMKYIDFKIKPLENIETEFTQLKSDVFDRFDWIAGSLKRIEEEMLVMNKHHRDLAEKVEENTKERIN